MICFQTTFNACKLPLAVDLHLVKSLYFYDNMHWLSDFNKQKYWAHENTLYSLPIADWGLWI